jgi:hypothetical protein
MTFCITSEVLTASLKNCIAISQLIDTQRSNGWEIAPVFLSVDVHVSPLRPRLVSLADNAARSAADDLPASRGKRNPLIRTPLHRGPAIGCRCCKSETSDMRAAKFCFVPGSVVG